MINVFYFIMYKYVKHCSLCDVELICNVFHIKAKSNLFVLSVLAPAGSEVVEIF